jgi:hypothetical protein
MRTLLLFLGFVHFSFFHTSLVLMSLTELLHPCFKPQNRSWQKLTHVTSIIIMFSATALIFLFATISWILRSDRGSNTTPRALPFPGVKRPKPEAEHSPPPSVEAKMCGTIPALPHTPSWQRNFYLSLTYVRLNHFKKASHKIGSGQTSKAIESHFFSTSPTTYSPNFLSQQQNTNLLPPQTQLNANYLNSLTGVKGI